MREKTQIRLCHCFAYNLPVSSHCSQGEKNPISSHEMQGHAFSSPLPFLQPQFVFFPGFLMYLFVMFLTLAKLITASQLLPTSSPRWAQSSLKAGLLSFSSSCKCHLLREALLEHPILNVPPFNLYP